MSKDEPWIPVSVPLEASRASPAHLLAVSILPHGTPAPFVSEVALALVEFQRLFARDDIRNHPEFDETKIVLTFRPLDTSHRVALEVNLDGAGIVIASTILSHELSTYLVSHLFA